VSALARQYVKRCDIRDFDDPALLGVISDLLPERDPREFAERKTWEYGMLLLFLEDVGLLRETTRALAVGAGDERVVFWLANHIAEVVATDVYGEGEFAEAEGQASMLANPAGHAPFPYREDHLKVMYMDGRALEFDDDSFDVVFSMSSIEHFGATHDIARSAREIGRVTRPGGYAFLTTECFVKKHPFNSLPVDLAIKAATLGRLRRRAGWGRRAGVDVLTFPEIRRHIIDASGLELMQRPDFSISPESFENLAVATRDGRVTPRSGHIWPHIVLEFRKSTYTSIALALAKPA
jgi:SAM-dependent methyltransferase